MAYSEFNENAFERELRAELARRLGIAGQASVDAARRLTPVDTGASWESITYEVDRDDLAMRFGSHLLRVRFLELGTTRQSGPNKGQQITAPRAMLRRALDDMGQRYLEIIERG